MPRLIQIIYEQEACQPWCAITWHLLLGSNKFIRKSCDSLFYLFVLNKLFLYINRHIRLWGVKFLYRFLFLEVTEGKFKCPIHPSLHAFASSGNDSAVVLLMPKFCSEGETSEGLGVLFWFISLFCSLAVWLHFCTIRENPSLICLKKMMTSLCLKADNYLC